MAHICALLEQGPAYMINVLCMQRKSLVQDPFPSLYPRHLCRRVYSFRFSVRPFVCSFVRSLVRSLFRNVRGIYVKVFVKVSLVVYIS